MMIQDDKPRSGYRQRLLVELRALAEKNAAEAPSPPRVARRPKLALAGIAGGACVASAAAFALAGGDDGSTAYAVVPQDDGSVTVEIKRLSDADGLERKLRANGIPAEVDYLAPGLTCKEPRFERSKGGGPSSLAIAQREDASLSFTVGANDLRPGQTLVVMSSGSAPEGATSIAVAVAQGAVAPCEPVQAPPIPDGKAVPAAPQAGTSTGGE
jgi:hypothetical protein